MRYLVATDLSQPSLEAAATAAAIARRTGAELRFYTAIPKAAAGHGELVDRIEARLDALSREYARLGFATGWAAETVDRVAQAIVDRAREERAHLVVIGARGVSGWEKLLVGSVAEQVIRLAPPMLLVGRTMRHEDGPRKVLVAVDRQPGAERAARLGFEFAAQVGAETRVLHVLEPPGAFVRVEERLGGVDPDEERRTRVAAAREELAAWLGGVENPGPPPAVRVVEGGVAERIEAEAGQWGADLIVLGMHGRTRAEEVLVGSTARKVTGVTTASVLLVRDRPAGHESA